MNNQSTHKNSQAENIKSDKGSAVYLLSGIIRQWERGLGIHTEGKELTEVFFAQKSCMGLSCHLCNLFKHTVNYID